MRFAVLALACLTATACGAGGGDDPGQGGAARHTLTIEQNFASEDGVVYMEGAVAEVVVLDAAGTARRASGDPSKPLTFSDLTAGRYTLQPGLLPCEANCGNLGPKRDACEATVTITSDTIVRVTYIPTQACEATEA